MIFVVISVLAVALICSSSYKFIVFAAPPAKGFKVPGADCVNSPETLSATCCWNEYDDTGPELTYVEYCQTCGINLDTGDFENCNDPCYASGVCPGALPQITTPQFGERAPQVPLQQLETAPSRVVPPIAEEEIQETPPEPLPPCPEGQELDEESGICVPIESPTTEQPEAAEEPPSEEQASEEDSSNN